MLQQIVSVLKRSETLMQDFAGASALAVLLVAGLYLPGLF